MALIQNQGFMFLGSCSCGGSHPCLSWRPEDGVTSLPPSNFVLRQGLSCNQDLTTLSKLPSYKSLGPVRSLLASGGITDVSHHIWFAVCMLEV